MEVRPFQPDDAQAALDLRVMAFTDGMHVDLADVDPEDGVPDDHRVVAVDDGELVGHLGVWPFRQSFGGRTVPMGGVAGVTVAHHRRGRGVGSALLAAGLELMADRGLVLSSLYPSLPLPYRRWGWEVAGDHVRRRLLLRDLLALPTRPDDIVLRPYRDEDLDAVVAVHDGVTRTEPGGLVAGARWIQRAFRTDPDEPEFAVVAERDGEVVGASLASKQSTSAPGLAFDLRVLHLVGVDWPVELALWHDLAGHHGVAEWATVNSRPADPLLFALPWALPGPHPSSQVWMSRLVDASAAIAARGWPAVRAGVPLAVHDPRVAANDGHVVLEARAGEAALVAGGPGRVGIDIGALSALFTGFVTPDVLARMGRLPGAEPTDLAVLAELFAVPSPYLRDYF